MALVPKINICVNNKCDTIDIYEQTGPYHATNNPEGWVNSGTVAANIDTSEIAVAVVTISDYTDTTVYHTYTMYDGVTDVYSGVAGAPLPSNFLALTNQSFTQGDGVYRLNYSVKSASTEFTNETQHVLITCGIEACINGLKAKEVVECDSNKLSKIKEKIDQLEIILYGIQSSFSCGDWTTAISLIESASTICDNLCDCGCGDC